MTRDEILAMEPGREMDALVAEVMGWERRDYVKSSTEPVDYYMIDVDEDNGGGIFHCKRYQNSDQPHKEVYFYMWAKFSPSTDIAAALEVVDKLARKKDASWYIETNYYADGKLMYWVMYEPDSHGTFEYIYESESLAEAISRVALLATWEME